MKSIIKKILLITILLAGGFIAYSSGDFNANSFPLADSLNTIRGTIRLNNVTGDGIDTAIVSHGVVKLFKVNPPNINILQIDSSIIQNNGDYLFQNVLSGQYYIVAYPNDDILDYVPTFYPGVQNWETALRITLSNGASRTCDINVKNLNYTPNGISINGIVTDSLTGIPLRYSVVYAISGSEYRGFSFSDSLGRYSFKSLLPGSYTFFSTRFMFRNQTKNVSLSADAGPYDFVLGRDSSYAVAVHSNSQVVKNFELKQNYPNPFNPSTKIEFSLQNKEFVTLKVYDTEGRIVKVLEEGIFRAGAYTSNFSGENLSSGVYYYELKTERFSEVKKMIFIK